MSVITFKYYRVIFEENDIIPILKSLAATSSFEPTKPLKSVTLESFDSESTNVKEVLENFIHLKELCEELISSKKIKGLKKAKVDQSYYKNLSSEIKRINEDSTSITTQLEELKSLNMSLQKLKTDNEALNHFSKIDLEVLGLEGKVVATQFCFVNIEDIEKVQNYLDAFEDLSGSWIAETLEGSYILFVTMTNNLESLSEFIKVNDSIKQISFENPEQLRSPKKLYEWNKEQLTIKRKKRDQLESNIEEEVRGIYPDLESIIDLLQLESEAYKMIDFIESYEDLEADRKQKLYEIRGWMGPEHVVPLNQVLKQFDDTAKLEELESSNRDDIRTGVKNNRFFKPFEAITNLMGTPSTNEIDPSAYMAIFFVVFFGFALGDSGYGLLLLIGFIIMYIKKYADDGMREASKLMIYCAISTIIFGLLSGGFFGNLEVQYNNPFQSFLLQFKVYDIEESLIPILMITLAAGFFQQVFGVILKMVSEIKNRNYYEAFSKSGTWLLLFASIAGYLLAKSYDVDGILKTASIIGLGLSLAIFAIGQGDSSKPLLIRPFIGIFSIFNITSYLSNTLSYARLLALGLATGVIATVINLIANIVADPSEPLGLIIFLLILIVGHLFNLALNLLGTSINIVRLQLVEFFPRFYEAKGIPLTPVKTRIKLENLPLGYIKNKLL
jgi:vacuolar-type H+-ATPase subunit I/STV1